MLLLMLIPQDVKNFSQKKYFDFAAEYELKTLATSGISGVKCHVFGTSMDTPGRADLLGILYYAYICR